MEVLAFSLSKSELRALRCDVMASRTEQSDLDIQSVLRAEIRNLKARHEIEIELLNARYKAATEGPRKDLPSLAHQVALLGQSELFDARWYLKSYPDVAKASADPAIHYIQAGCFEGRNPSANFDSMAYYLANSDVAIAGWPALVHYLDYGEAEGRPLK